MRRKLNERRNEGCWRDSPKGGLRSWSSPNTTILEISLPLLLASIYRCFVDTAVLRECEAGQAARRQGAKSTASSSDTTSLADHPSLVLKGAQSGCREFALFICSVTFTGI